jgi:hypothetical protein
VPGDARAGGASRSGAGSRGVGAGSASLGDVGLGDVIRAWRWLDARTEDERRAIARMLGFELREATPTPEPRRKPPTIAPEPGPSGGVAIPPAPPPVTEAPQAIDLVPFTDVQVNPVELPAEGLPRPTAVQPAVLEPLFEPGWSRAIASTLTEHSAPVGPLDIDRTIDLLARRLPIRTLPRRDRLVSATEVVVVVDTRGTLAWFRDDAAQLIDRVDAVTRAPVAVVEADGAPVLTSAMGTRDTVRPRTSDLDEDEPSPDRVRIGAHGRIIGVTDLGLGSPWMRGDPARAEAWADLAIALRARGASLAIVTPVPIERVRRRLPRLARLVPCIYWDRSTQPGLVHRLIKGLT